MRPERGDDHALELFVKGRSRRLMLFFAGIAIIAGVLSAWSVRHSMNPDGISYLDMGDAFTHGRSGELVNGCWSPLYPALLGAGMSMLQPSAYWEFPAVHLINLLVYVAAVFSFSYLLGGLTRSGRHWREARPGERRVSRLPDWFVVVVGYTLFIWVSLDLVSLRVVSPDLLVSAILYASLGILVRQADGVQGSPSFVLFGCLLGLGYLAKTPMFFVSGLLLVLSFRIMRRRAGGVRRVLLSVLIFMLVSAAFIGRLSSQKGYFTIGESAALNYAWFVDGVTSYFHWQGGPSGYGDPAHPTRQISLRPAVYEFSSPVAGTYPVWYDPSYWYQGVTPRFALGPQMAALWRNVQAYAQMIYPDQLGLIIGCLLLVLFGGRWRLGPGGITPVLLLSVSLCGLTMYSLVSVLPRYVGPLILVGWLGVLSAAYVPEGAARRWQYVLVLCVMLALPSARIASAIGANAVTLVNEAGRITDRSPAREFQIAEACHRAGITEGEKIGIIGPAYLAYWARLARVQIIAEMPQVESVSWDDEAARGQIVGTFQRTGARAVVAIGLPAAALDAGWQRMEGTELSVYMFTSGTVNAKPEERTSPNK